MVYVTYWKKEYKSFSKIRQSLRSVHFGEDYEKALEFFCSLDRGKKHGVYRANLKVFADGKASILRSL